MNKEEYKLEFIRVARESPEIISQLALASNYGNPDRKKVYAPETVYYHELMDLFIRIVLNQDENNIPEFQLQFHDGAILPENWDKPVYNIFHMNDVIRYIENNQFRCHLRNIDYEQIDFEKNSLCFYAKRVSIYAKVGEPVLITEELELNSVKVHLDKECLYFENIDGIGKIRRYGRGIVYKSDYFVDYEFNESNIQLLSKTMIDWGIRNQFSEEKMQKINDFCLYCKRVKGTKRKSKMISIMEYIRDNLFPC